MLGAPGPDFGTWDAAKPNSNAQIQMVADLDRWLFHGGCARSARRKRTALKNFRKLSEDRNPTAATMGSGQRPYPSKRNDPR